MPKTKATYSEIDDIIEDLNSLKSNVVELTKHVKKDSRYQTEELRNVMFDRWEEFQSSSKQRYKDIEKRVKAKPGQSMAIAFAAGLAASVLLRRR
ncbi:MAG: hypothetical protein GC137_09750 [Alphaproteobacteria bacterium]|nr:hypothetical protein [Alphaproteobacteria bacterium]